MKYLNQEINNINHLAKRLILKRLCNLEDEIHKREFGNFDIRSKIALELFNSDPAFGWQMNEQEGELLIKNISFEIAKIISTLENSCGSQTGIPKKSSAGYPTKQRYGL